MGAQVQFVLLSEFHLRQCARSQPRGRDAGRAPRTLRRFSASCCSSLSILPCDSEPGCELIARSPARPSDGGKDWESAVSCVRSGGP